MLEFGVATQEVPFGQDWLAIPGNLAQQLRAVDWQRTSYGEPGNWQARLQGTVDIVLAHATSALLLHGPDRCVIYNAACARLIGELHPALLGTPLGRGWPGLQAQARNAITAAYAGTASQLQGRQFAFRYQDMRTASLDLHFTPVFDEDGVVIAVLVLIDDTTARSRHARSVRHDAAKLGAIFERAQVGLSEISLAGRFIRVNDALCRMLERSRESLLQLGVPDVTDKADIEHSLAAVGKLVGDGVPVSLDKRYLRPNGDIVWANSSISRLNPVQPGDPCTLLAVTVDLTERTLAKQALAESEARFRVLAEASPVLIWQIDTEMNLVYTNPKCVELFGEAGTAPGKGWISVLHPDDSPVYLQAADQALKEHEPFQQRVRVCCADGSVRWIEVYAGPWFRVDGGYAGHLGIGIDVTQTVHTQEQLMISNERLHLAIDGSGDGVWDWNIGTNDVSYSRRMKEIIGFAEEDEFDTYDAWVRRIHRDDLATNMAALDACLSGKVGTYNAEYRMRCKNQVWKWILARAIVVARDDTGRPLRMTGTVTDVSDERQSQEVIWLHANFDALTGLPNRRLFRDRLDHEAKTAHRNSTRFALLFIDLDHFKEANDLLGHDAGDQLLAQAARRIMACVRASDTVARLGGDEFTAILTQLDDPADIEAVARTINESLAAPFTLGNEVVHLSASIGITLYPTDARTPEELIRNADQAMYVAKNGGRNQFNYFTPEMQHRAQDRLRLIADLRGALAAGQLEVYYQPVVDMATCRIRKAEALLRWNHPRQGLLEPAAFIPFAEESGLILEIGDWVFEEAATCCRRWRSLVGEHFQVSVNRSPTQFMSRVNGTHWPHYLEQMGMAGSSMSVEITEAVLLNASSRVERQLLQYRDAGIQVAIDDFGTGYSSLAYLKKFEIDYLKIDQSFIQDMCRNEGDRAIVRSVTAMGHELGLKVIAEGIETQEQHALLVSAGCDFGQGFHYARPLPQADFERLLRQPLPL